jgi:hypothetical protein
MVIRVGPDEMAMRWMDEEPEDGGNTGGDNDAD